MKNNMTVAYEIYIRENPPVSKAYATFALKEIQKNPKKNLPANVIEYLIKLLENES